MKVLFVCEGRHEIGPSPPNPHHPRPAGGTIPALARRICPSISVDSVALSPSDIVRFNPIAKKRGYEFKLAGAVLLATRKFGCDGTVFVVDRDRETNRPADLQDAVAITQAKFPSHPMVCGVAIESVEAWTLGDPQALAGVLNIELQEVQRVFPRGIAVEDHYEKSGKVEHRPKQLLRRLAELANETDSDAFRERIAEKTDIVALTKACPDGFGRFVSAMRAAFPT